MAEALTVFLTVQDPLGDAMENAIEEAFGDRWKVRAALAGLRRREPTRRMSLLSAAAMTLLVAGCGQPEIQRPTSPLLCPRDVAPSHAFDGRELLGLTVSKARRKAAEGGCRLFVSKRDGELQGRTAEDNPRRLNVWVEDRVVVRLDGVN
jgi:ABC-type uncharacterized transport system auxiliary subunit